MKRAEAERRARAMGIDPTGYNLSELIAAVQIKELRADPRRRYEAASLLDRASEGERR